MAKFTEGTHGYHRCSCKVDAIEKYLYAIDKKEELELILHPDRNRIRVVACYGKIMRNGKRAKKLTVGYLPKDVEEVIGPLVVSCSKEGWRNYFIAIDSFTIKFHNGKPELYLRMAWRYNTWESGKQKRFPEKTA